MKGLGPQLRAAREARGLPLAAVAAKTRIPEEHLRAMEADEWESLPPGPYRRAWTRNVCELLGIEEPEATPESEPVPALNLDVVRGLALASVFAVLGLIAWLQWAPTPGPVADPEPVTPDQHLEVGARNTVRIRVEVDGEVAFEGRLEGGAKRSFDAFDEIVLDVPAVEAVTLRYNDRSIRPQGRQDAPRRIVFVDDEAE